MTLLQIILQFNQMRNALVLSYMERLQCSASPATANHEKINNRNVPNA